MDPTQYQQVRPARSDGQQLRYFTHQCFETMTNKVSSSAETLWLSFKTAQESINMMKSSNIFQNYHLIKTTQWAEIGGCGWAVKAEDYCTEASLGISQQIIRPLWQQGKPSHLSPQEESPIGRGVRVCFTYARSFQTQDDETLLCQVLMPRAGKASH